MPASAADDTIEIATTPEERGLAGNPVVSYTFRLSADGGFSVAENWTEKEETYAAGRTIMVPARVWTLAWAWLAARVPPRRIPSR